MEDQEENKRPRLTRADKIISAAVAIEEESADNSDAMAFMARNMVMATLPHRKVKGNEFVRKNGDFILTMLAPSAIGLPYGSIPRLLSAWVTTEAVQTKSQVLELGDSLSYFMRQLDMEVTGGVRGTITAFKEQARRFFACSFSAYSMNERRSAEMGFRVADDSIFWWDNPNPEQAGLWSSNVKLTERFFKEVTERPVPIDMRAISALKKSPLALDIYCWSTYRASYIRAKTTVPWDKLALQFGSDYTRLRAFKAAFVDELKKVQTLYNGLNFEPTEDGLVLKPSPTHIRKLSTK
jgi:hypothetical protein